MKLRLLDATGRSLGHIDVLDEIFNAPAKPALVHQVVVARQANERQGTVSTKTRAEVSGGGKKPWRQKGTGRARHGSIRSPIWRGGGVTFGPKPRNYTQRTPKRMRRAALFSSLSAKARSGDLLILDRLQLEELKTRHLVSVLRTLNVSGSTLLVGDGTDPEVLRCARNVPQLRTMPAFQLNAADLLRSGQVIMTLEAVREAERIWGPGKTEDPDDDDSVDYDAADVVNGDDAEDEEA